MRDNRKIIYIIWSELFVIKIGSNTQHTYKYILATPGRLDFGNTQTIRDGNGHVQRLLGIDMDTSKD